MKKLLLWVPVLVCMITFFGSCSKEEGPATDNTVQTKLTVFKNQTGNSEADALQAQYIGDENKYVLNFYGTFNIDNTPKEINTITFQKKDNDTVVSLILEPITKRISSSIVTVKGVKSPIVMKYDYYSDNSNSVAVSLYNYDWNSNTSELIHTSRFDNNNGVKTESSIFAKKNRTNLSSSSNTFGSSLIAVGVGIGVAEAISALGGGFSLLPVLSTATSAVIASTLAVPIVTGVAIGVTIIAISAILNPANASELTPQDTKYPKNTTINNPNTGTNNPLNNLLKSSCVNTNITFNVTMDGFGSIMFWGVNGGQPPYQYKVNSGYQQNEVFSNNYPNGSYFVSVKDANGCINAKYVDLTRQLTAPKWYVGKYTLDNDQTILPLNGQSGNIYIYQYYTSYPGSSDLFPVYIFYVKSIIPGMPNFYNKKTEALLDNKHIVLSRWKNDLGSTSAMDFSIYCDVVDGISITTANTANNPSINSRVKKFTGPDQFAYMINLQANFSLVNPPIGLTEENINQIKAMILNENLNLMIEE